MSEILKTLEGAIFYLQSAPMIFTFCDLKAWYKVQDVGFLLRVVNEAHVL